MNSHLSSRASVFARRVRVEVGGLSIAAEADASVSSLGVDGDEQAFLSGDGPADLRLTVSRGAIPEGAPEGARVFVSGGAWNLATVNGDEVYSLQTPATGPVPYSVARIARDWRTGSVLFDASRYLEGDVLFPLRYPLGELLFLRLLAAGRGVELHSCGLRLQNGVGVLFCGQSGHGKTTMARLWSDYSGVTVLSDDRIIVRKENGQYWIHGTPWHGDAQLAVNAKVPLAAVYILDRGPRNVLRPLSSPAAAALLLARGFLPFHDRRALEFAAEFLGDLASALPCRLFEVSPGPAACRVVLEDFDGISRLEGRSLAGDPASSPSDY